jgi:hypothetical protein
MTRVDISAHPDDVRAFLTHRLAQNVKARRFLGHSKLKADILEKLPQKVNGM